MMRSPRFILASMTGRIFPSVSISSNKSMTPDGAPPCNGPFIVPIADVIADVKSDSVEMVTRAAKVDAFNPCSIVNFKYVSSASTCTSFGITPVSIHK